MLIREDQKYSAILVTYNATAHLERAITSILNQEVAPSEVIVVDDCSIDDTITKATRLLSDFPSKIIQTNIINLGQSHSRNLAASLASNTNLIFFDDDDFSLPSRSSLHLDALRHSDLSYVSSTKTYSSGYEVPCLNSDYVLSSGQFLDLILYLILGKRFGKADLFVPSSTLACKKSSFIRIGGFDVNFRRQEDVDFAIRAAVEGMRITWASRKGVQRFHTQNESKGRGLESSYELLLITKFRALITLTHANKARFLSTLRMYYFSRSYTRLFFFVSSNPIYWWFVIKKFPTLVRRIMHEVRM